MSCNKISYGDFSLVHFSCRFCINSPQNLYLRESDDWACLAKLENSSKIFTLLVLASTLYQFDVSVEHLSSLNYLYTSKSFFHFVFAHADCDFVHLIKKTLNNFMAPFYGWGSTATRLEPLRGGSLLFTIKFPDIPDTHFTNLGRMKGWANLGATQWFWTRHPWIGNPDP